MKSERSISVIIPCYKQGRYLAEAIESCLSQDRRDTEIIVVNDGSPDDTGKVARSFGNRIVYIEQENRGLSAARNAGIRAARGDYVALLDSDDLMLRGSLGLRADFLDAHPLAGLVCGDVLLFDEDGDMGLKSAWSGRPRNPANFRWETVGFYATPSTVMVRREVFEKAGLFDEGVRGGGEDWLMWVRIARFFQMAYLERPVIRYRLHQASATTDTAKLDVGNRSAVRTIVDSPDLMGYPAPFRARLLYYRFATAWRVESKWRAAVYLGRAFFTSPPQVSFGLGVIKRGVARTLRRKVYGREPYPRRREEPSNGCPSRSGPASDGAPPRVSVIIPCYNQGRFLAESVRSVLDQGYPDTEIIVINDGSTDDTAAVARSFGERIIYMEQENSGVSVARSTAVTRSTGRYIAFLDSDDLLLAGSLKARVAVLDARPDVGLVCGDALTPEKGGRVVLKSTNSRTPRNKDGFRWETVSFCATTSTVMVRRECLEEAGPFETTLRQGQDWYQWVKLSRLCEMVYLDIPLAVYRIHDTNVTAVTERVNRYNRLAARMAVEAPFFKEYPGHFQARLLYYRFATAWYEGPKRKALWFLGAALRTEPREVPFGIRIVAQGLGNALRRFRGTYP